jgi:hypothetical protein
MLDSPLPALKPYIHYESHNLWSGKLAVDYIPISPTQKRSEATGLENKVQERRDLGVLEAENL